MALLAAPKVALAADDCGPIINGEVTCTSAGNNYPSGISYTPANDLTMVVQDGVTVAPITGNDGIFINSSFAIVDLSIEENASIATQGFYAEGVFIREAYEVTVELDGEVTTNGFFAEGIYIDDTAGTVKVIASGSITTNQPFSSGLYVRDTGGNLIVELLSGSVITAKGAFSFGIRSYETDGDVTISLSSGSFIQSADGNAISVSKTGGAFTLDLSEGSHIEAYGIGVQAVGTTGQTVVTSSGVITTGGHGLYIQGSHDVEIRSSGSITTYGSHAMGMFLYYNDGEISIESATAISTHGQSASGIVVRPVNDHDVSILHSGKIETLGDYAHGIYVFGGTQSKEGNVSITTSSASSIATAGESAHGIFIEGADNILGDVSLNVSGAINAIGENASAILVTGVAGAVDITVGGDVYGRSAGITLENPNAASRNVTILSGGSLAAVSGVAIDSDDLDLTIDNYGTVKGNLRLGNGNDVFHNRAGGIWYIPMIDSATYFNGGSDMLLNSGTISLIKDSESYWQQEISGLEIFTHSGAIVLADGMAGDSLFISGEFVSDGGSLWLDALLDGGNGQADVLILSSVTTDHGPTLVYVTNTGGQSGQTEGDGLRIIDVQTSASDPQAFALGRRVIVGAYEYGLEQVDEDWYLQSFPFTGAADYPALMAGVLWSFGTDVDALHERLHDLRSSFGPDEEKIEPAAYRGPAQRARPWLHVTGASQEIVAALPRHQEALKLAGGIDTVIETASGKRYVFGAFAGTGAFEQNFDGSSARLDSDLAFAGLYAGVRAGGFYGDALVKYEHHLAAFGGESTHNEPAPVTLDLRGGSLESGYRFAWGGSYLRPRARLTYVHADEASFEDGGGATIRLAAAESLAGEAAARLGLGFPRAGGFADFHIEGGVHHEILGETEAQASDLFFTASMPGTAGFLSAGASFVLDGSFLSIKAGWTKSEDAQEVTATAALRADF